MKQHSYDHSSGDQSNSNAMVQALLARQQLEEEEKRYSIGGVPVPSEMSNSSPLMQAVLARQLADQENEDQYPMHDENPSSSSALAQAMAARNRVEDEENNQYDIFNRSSAVTEAMQARRRAEDTEDDMGDLPHPVSNVMMQVMQARQQAQEDDRIQWMTAPQQNPGPSGSSALIQAMLARQAAQNEYDDGYWTKCWVLSYSDEKTDVWKTSTLLFKTEFALCEEYMKEMSVQVHLLIQLLYK